MTAMDIVGSRDAVVTALKALEYEGKPLRVVTSLAKVNPPCVMVALDSMDHYNVGGEVVWRLYLTAPFTDDERAIEDLQKVLDVVLPAVEPTAPTEYVGLPTPEQAQALPALLIRISHTI